VQKYESFARPAAAHTLPSGALSVLWLSANILFVGAPGVCAPPGRIPGPGAWLEIIVPGSSSAGCARSRATESRSRHKA